MRRILNYAGFVFILLLAGAASISAAQDGHQITIVGSRIGNALIDALSNVHAAESVAVTTNGTSAGIQQFCGGGADIVSALRPISAAEVADCISNDVAFSEFLIAHKIVAFAAHNSAPVTCLTRNQIEAFVKPSVSNRQLDWSEFSEGDDAPAFTLLLPATGTLEYSIVDELVAGDLLRRDAVAYVDINDGIERVAETAGALAVLPFASDLPSRDEVKLLGFQDQDSSACVSPSAESVESNQYSAARSIYVYVNRQQLEANEALSVLLQDLIGGSSAEKIADAGFTPPSAERIAINSDVLIDPSVGASLGEGQTEFEIPAGLSGEINIVGTANVHRLIRLTSDNLTRGHGQLQVNIQASDSESAVQKLCGGDVQIAMVDMQVDGDANLPCDGGQGSLMTLPIGTQAAVLLGNSADAFAQCLTLDQISRIWTASETESAANWDEIDDAFPSLEMALFGTAAVDRNADMLLARRGQVTPPIRRDTERDFDLLYRAAAVGNVPGSLTYMSWQDYARVLANQQQNVHLVSVDAGSGCVTASEASIVDGNYALARPGNLLVDSASLANINVQSLLWHLYADDNWSNFEREGFVGMALADLAAHRRHLETQFRLAEAHVAQADSSAETESANDSDAD